MTIILIPKRMIIKRGKGRYAIDLPMYMNSIWERMREQGKFDVILIPSRKPATIEEFKMIHKNLISILCTELLMVKNENGFVLKKECETLINMLEYSRTRKELLEYQGRLTAVSERFPEFRPIIPTKKEISELVEE